MILIELVNLKLLIIVILAPIALILFQLRELDHYLVVSEEIWKLQMCAMLQLTELVVYTPLKLRIPLILSECQVLVATKQNLNNCS
jgi:hypothetical protein